MKSRRSLTETMNIEEEQGFLTEGGEVVRSKSEKIIADKLHSMNIPYVYEVVVKLEGHGKVHPDFTVLNTRTREEFYWEHLGMMDLPEYSNKAIKKIDTYEKNGVFVGKKLLVTYETSFYPLNIRSIERTIKEYLLKSKIPRVECTDCTDK